MWPGPQVTNTEVKKVELKTESARRGEGRTEDDGKSPSSLNPHQQLVSAPVYSKFRGIS